MYNKINTDLLWKLINNLYKILLMDKKLTNDEKIDFLKELKKAIAFYEKRVYLISERRKLIIDMKKLAIHTQTGELVQLNKKIRMPNKNQFKHSHNF